MSREAPRPVLRPCPFFVVRSPLLPFDELLAWSAGAASRGDEETAETLAAERARLRAGLAAIIERPAVRDAVFVASPDLYDSLDLWRREPESKKGQRTEKALVRYFQRMAGRATPFGLFSGCAVGDIGTRTRLDVPERSACRRHSRLDMGYLSALAQDLERDPALRAELLFRPSSSLYRAAGRLRYAEGRMRDRRRFYFLVAVEETPYLDATLRRAAPGARRADLATALVEDDPDGEITLEEAEEYVDSLIDAQILVSDLAPLVTGAEPIHDLIDTLRPCAAAAPIVERLDRVRSELARIDAGGPGADPESYRGIARLLAELPTPVELPRLFQVDMIKPGDGLELSPEVIDELARGVELMCRLSPPLDKSGFDHFRAAFLERYGEGREIPLAEALDDEVGIGFERVSGAGGEPSPLLEGLAPPAAGGGVQISWGPREEILLRKIEQALAAGAVEIHLDPGDVEKLAPSEPQILPGSLAALATLAAAAPEDADRGDFRLAFHYAVGPSAARLFGRFCHGDEALRRRVEEHLRDEERLDPDAVYAEIVHLPEGRLGNILCRPVLRGYEIPYLGRSGAPPERCLPLSDLLVTVRGDEIHLRSRRLGRRVVPRLTTAHNYQDANLRIYRFLCKLQNLPALQYLIWKWEPLTSFSFLPRVVSGRLVLSRARWLVRAPEIEKLVKTAGTERLRAVRRWRAERRLPRFAALTEWDNELPVDLDNPLAVDSFLDTVRQRPAVVLRELFPEPAELCARGPEGRFVHEILVPFVRAAEPPVTAPAVRIRPEPAPAAVTRAFPPGSEWLYAKLYTGTATADRLLRELVSPLRAEILSAGAADRWFFIRYADPEWHLRLRFHGVPERLLEELLPRLTAAAQEMLADGRLAKLQLDTYEREVERYGGPAGIEIAERLFQADSDAVLEIVESIDGDEAADARWRLALAGVDRLLSDLGFDLAAKGAIGERLRDHTDYAHALGERYRRERPRLEPLLDPARDGEGDLAPGLALLQHRSQTLAPVAAELRSLAGEGRLTRPVEDLAASFIHMHVNRMIRAGGPEHERVIYDFLARLYESRLVRSRATPSQS